MSDDFAALDDHLAAQLGKLKPGRRRQIARKIGMELRKSNAKRIADNVQPDGTAMQPRKKRNLKAGKDGIKKGRMFRKLRLARSFRVNPSADGVSVGFEGIVAHTARAHHYGLYDFVGKTEAGKTVRARFPRRDLIGFSPEDRAMVPELILSMLEEES